MIIFTEDKSKMRILLIIIVSITSFYGCSQENETYVYVVVKPDVEESNVSEWRPVMRVTYRIFEDTVVSEVAGLLDEYKNCIIKNKNNWQCQYEDGTGSNRFGFKSGQYYESPGWGDAIRHVSRWEYNLIRCKWYQHDSGKLEGAVSCLKTYI